MDVTCYANYATNVAHAMSNSPERLDTQVIKLRGNLLDKLHKIAGIPTPAQMPIPLWNLREIAMEGDRLGLNILR